MSSELVNRRVSPARFWAMTVKEFIQMRRDRMTFAMMVAVPIVQLLLFGYAINGDPKHLSTAVLMADSGPQARTVLNALKNSGYFRFIQQATSEAEADELLNRGDVQFVVEIPEDFSHSLLRGEQATLFIAADATDPGATGNAMASLQASIDRALQNDFKGPLEYLATRASAVTVRMHARYNPETITQYNIVPGLMGVVLTMTMVIITGLAITRERERGTMENLLSMPTRPTEVLIGKIAPYILVGYVQVSLILLAARFIFHVPMIGSVVLLLGACLFFIAANLAMGVTFSTVAKNQLQAMQMAIFFFLPSMLLSGFMFPFRGMPTWAQWLGEVLPITHFLRIARGILLKGNGIAEIWPELWPILLFTAVVLTIGVKRYKQTLD